MRESRPTGKGRLGASAAAATDDARLEHAMQKADDLLVQSLQIEERQRARRKYLVYSIVGGLTMLAILCAVLVALTMVGTGAAAHADESAVLTKQGWQLWQARQVDEAAQNSNRPSSWLPRTPVPGTVLAGVILTRDAAPRPSRPSRKPSPWNRSILPRSTGWDNWRCWIASTTWPRSICSKPPRRRRQPGTHWPSSTCSKANTHRPRNGRRRSSTRAKATTVRGKCLRPPRTGSFRTNYGG